MALYRMNNKTQPYAWGSHSFIQALIPSSVDEGKPAAELWMGAHPAAVSDVCTTDGMVPLDHFLNDLRSQSENQACSQLPYLLKVLAAEKALSIQAHPDLEQAKEGFLFENLMQIPLDSPERTFKDSNHKPELICALTEFHAMCGFRAFSDIIKFFQRYELSQFFRSFEILAHKQNGTHLKWLINEILSIDKQRKAKVIAKLRYEVDQEDFFLTHEDEQTRLVHYWVGQLLEQFPDDIGVLSPLLLNIIVLKPFEAIFLPAKVLHAYLRGAGMEIMASSDNVLRGGLTPKYINVEQLLSIIDFKKFRPKIHKSRPSAGLHEYKTPVTDFRFWQLRLKKGNEYQIAPTHNQIIFCYEGIAELTHEGQNELIRAGESLFITSSQVEYGISGKGICFIASY